MQHQTSHRYCILVADPRNYRIYEAISSLCEDWWQSKGKAFQIGQGVATWKTKADGRLRGIIALGEVVANPTIRRDNLNPFHLDAAFAAAKVERVGIRYLPIAKPLWAGEEHTEMLSTLSVYNARGGTVFAMSVGQWQYLLRHAGQDESDPASVRLSIDEIRRRRLHWRAERNWKASQLAKATHGFACQACEFNFSEHYGDLGENFIEAHHLVPLRTLKDGEQRTYHPEDFAVLCANCHRMIHRTEDPSDLASFRDRLS